jgi:hypothetical protein
MIAALAIAIGAMLGRLAGAIDRDGLPPAGFVRGMAQGALMPLAMPYLLVGRDLPIYALRNTGRTYKLGYTVGVNGCGAIFFGALFWRLNRLRRRLGARAGSRANPELDANMNAAD